MPRHIALLPALVVAAVLVAAAPAPGQTVITACVKLNQGQVRIVAASEACGPSEAKVTWNIAGPQGPKGDVGPAGPPGPKGDPGTGGGGSLVVLDSTGTIVGWVMTINVLSPYGLPGALVVAVPRTIAGEETFLELRADETGFVADPSCSLYYEALNCEGIPYAQFVTMISSRPLAHDTRIWNGKVFVPTGEVHAGLFLSSRSNPDGPCVNGTRSVSASFQFITFDVAEFGTPPFRLTVK